MLDNAPGFIDSHDTVVRVNNYKVLSEQTGLRTDVFYSFFGTSIRKAARDLIADGVTLCMCKCPNSYCIDSRWHRTTNRMRGVDFRYIYEERANWWFCETYVPEDADFLEKFNLLDEHVPTTGFAAILDIIKFSPKSVYLTGFDFFRSGIHNVSDPWIKRNNDDPIRHEPERELQWLAANADSYPLSFDRRLAEIIAHGGDNRQALRQAGAKTQRAKFARRRSHVPQVPA